MSSFVVVIEIQNVNNISQAELEERIHTGLMLAGVGEENIVGRVRGEIENCLHVHVRLPDSLPPTQRF